jgi:hypothetical protein
MLDKNIEIAKMLGWEETTLEFKLKWCCCTPDGLTRLNPEVIPILNRGGEVLFIDTIFFDSDCGWLMRAVNFIEAIQTETSTFEIHMQKRQILIKEERNYSFEKGDGGSTSQPLKLNGNTWTVGKTREEALFEAVYQFSKLYNNKLL